MRLELRAGAGASIGLVLLAIVPAMLIALAPSLAVKIVCVICVAALLALAVVLGKRKLVIDERGVTAKGAFGIKRVDWNEVDHYTFWSMDQTAAYAAGGSGGAIGVIVAIGVIAAIRALRKSKTKNRRFGQGQLVLVTKQGMRLPIDNRYARVADALDRAFDELHPRLRGATHDFAPFALSDTELRHVKKGSLGLADIQHVAAAGTRLVIKKSGKRLAWVSVPMRRIKNVMLFVELLAERGLVIKANADVFMPPTVLDKLRAATARQAALPQARVVARD
jgi:hypothetical protein